MFVRELKKDCCGCTTCMNICPQKCIEMTTDEEGFLYPHIDEKKCINCNLCRKICPFQEGGDNLKNESHNPIVLAAKHKDDDIRMSSSSGGAFTAISDFVLNENGVIIGVAFDDNFKVCHQVAFDKKGRDRFKGSKYVQSHLGDIFLKVQKHLEDKIVLFSGTPCQVAGLKAFLKDDYHNLITCDIVCHGVSSPKVFKDYLDFMENKFSSSTKNINFREKKTGWHSFSCVHEFENKIVSKVFSCNPFCSLFNKSLILRQSCHNCVFTNFERPSDITLADFWGIQRVKPEFDDNKGISLIILNTRKGELIFEKIKDCLYFRKSNVSECVQPNLREPTKSSGKRNMFWKDYKNRGFKYVAKKYTGFGIISNIKHIIILLLTKTRYLNK